MLERTRKLKAGTLRVFDSQGAGHVADAVLRQPRRAENEVECTRWTLDDHEVFAELGRERVAAAAPLVEVGAKLRAAGELGLDDAEFYYNQGLLEFDAGDMESARRFAVEAYSRGYPLPGLRLKLAKAGVPLQ